MKSHLSSLVSILFIIFVFLLVSPSLSLAQVVQLAWDPSPSSDVTGYKIYYKSDSSELPLDGVEALEGPSPIDVGNVTSFALTELPEGSVYYFRATAYDSAGYESALSNLVASAWIPAPISPEIGERAGAPVTLVWCAPPQDLNLTFTVIYGTDPQLQTSSATIAASKNGPGRPFNPAGAPLLAALLCLAGLTLLQLTAHFGKKRLLAAMVCLGLTLSTASCGGGGGGSSRAPTSLPQQVDTVVVAGLTDSYFTTDDLESGVTYYWQVIATDGSGQQYESIISSFIAE